MRIARPLLLLAAATAVAITAAAPAAAAERSFSVSSFDRIRIEGPFEVRIATGQAPGAKAVADTRSLDVLDIRVEGTTLIVRLSGEGWGERPRTATTAPVVTLRTPALRAAVVNAGGRVTITGMKGQRLDLSVNGSGALAVTGVETDQLNATVIGTGTIALAGRAARAQLLMNGPGAIDATALGVNDLTVRLDGTGETKAAARYTAIVTTTGLGRVTVAGSPACTVKAIAGGPVSCGKATPTR